MEDKAKRAAEGKESDPKRLRPEENGEDDSEDSGSAEDDSGEELDLGEDAPDESDEEEMGDLIVNFEGYSPEEEDLSAVEALVSQLYRGLPVSSALIAKLIVDNDRFSTVLKDEDPEEQSVFGVSSVINLTQPYNDTSRDLALQYQKMVKEGYLRHTKRSGADALPEVLKKFEITTEVKPDIVFGLVVAEKLVNIPAPAMWKLLYALKEDMKDQHLQYTHYLLMTKFYKVGQEEVPYEEYYQPLQNASTFSIDFPLPKDTDVIPHNGEEGIPFRRLFVIPAPAFEQCVEVMGSQ